MTTGGVLVGRDAEVGQLDRAVHELASGHGGSIWVEGEPGIGKSALLAAGLASAERLGCQVFWAAAAEPGQRFPLRVMLECLGVRGSTDPRPPEIARPLPGGETPTVRTSVDPVSAATERLLAVVDRRCAVAPAVLVVDEMQWADEASMVVWHRLDRSVQQMPLLLVAACRPTPRRTELVRLRHSVAASGSLLISLGPLATASVDELIGRFVGSESVGAGLRRAVEPAAGNPLYVRELVDALSREGRLAQTNGIADLVEDVTSHEVSVSLAAVISDRLGCLSSDTSETLRAAALLGRAFSAADVGAVAGRTAVELVPVVDEAMGAGVLVESGTRLAFRHDLIRQVLFEATPEPTRPALHRQAARMLAEVGLAVEPVAEQLLAALPESPGPDSAGPDSAGPDSAGPVAVDDWVLDWLLGPGRALNHRTPQVAADLLARAVGGARPGDPRREVLEAGLAPVLVLLGRRDEAERLAQRVLDTTRDPGRAAEMSWTLAWALGTAQQYEQARAVLDRALRSPTAGGVWAARLRAMLSRVAAAEGDLDEAAGAAEQALADADRTGDRVAAASALHVTGLVRVFRGDPAGAMPAYERALGLVGNDAESADIRLTLLANQMDLLATLDRMSEATAAMRRLLPEAERSAAPSRLGTVRLAAAELSYHAGLWDGARAELEAAADVYDQLATRNQRWLHGLGALIAAHRDDQPTAEAHLTAERAMPPRDPFSGPDWVLFARAVCAERHGHPEQALALLTELLDPARADEVGDQREALPDIVRLALLVGDEAAARAAADACGTDPAAEPTGSHAAAALHCRGLLDADPGKLTAAADIYRTVGRPVRLAHTLGEAAVMLARRGDLRAARAANAEAVDIYTPLGADWDLARLASQLRLYGLRRPSGQRKPATGLDALTATERKIAGMVAAGLSNPDIASEFVLSRRTVEVHVSHILAKLGARSRIDLARDASIRQLRLERLTG